MLNDRNDGVLPPGWLLRVWRSAPASAPPAAAAAASSAPPERHIPSQTAAPAPVDDNNEPNQEAQVDTFVLSLAPADGDDY